MIRKYKLWTIMPCSLMYVEIQGIAGPRACSICSTRRSGRIPEVLSPRCYLFFLKQNYRYFGTAGVYYCVAYGGILILARPIVDLLWRTYATHCPITIVVKQIECNGLLAGWYGLEVYDSSWVNAQKWRVEIGALRGGPISALSKVGRGLFWLFSVAPFVSSST